MIFMNEHKHYLLIKETFQSEPLLAFPPVQRPPGSPALIGKTQIKKTNMTLAGTSLPMSNTIQEFMATSHRLLQPMKSSRYRQEEI